MIEYHSLTVKDDNSIPNGWLVGIERHIGNHFKFGIGYNFSDNLKLTDYSYRGWFVNLIGKY